MTTTFEPDGSPFVADPRHVLAGVVERFAKDGLTPVVAVELEFYLIDAQRAADGMPQVPIMPRTGRRADSLQVYGIAELDDFAGLFAEVAAFKRAVDAVVRSIKASPTLPGFDEVLLPGETSHAKRRDRRANGIPIHDALHAELDKLARDLGIRGLAG